MTEKIIQIGKKDFKQTIVYLFILHQLLDQQKKTPGIPKKKLKELMKECDKLEAFIEKYEDDALK